MLKTTETLLESPMASHVFTWPEIEQVFDGTLLSRYALINKALKKQEILKLKRGAFLLAPKYQQKPISLYYVANQLAFDSYISMETALAFHQWIPERVITIMCIIATGRNRKFKTPIGNFHYYKIPIHDTHFFCNVNYMRENQQSFLMASPLRALADLIYVKKIDYTDISFLEKGLRIETNELESIDIDSISHLQQTYRSARVQHFLKKLKRELFNNE